MHRITIAMIAGTCFVASADIVRVNEFDSLEFEGFNNLDMKTFDRNPVSVFNGMGEVLNTKGSFLHATSRWSLRSGDWRGQARAYEGSKMLGNTAGGIEYRFNTAQKSFGGFFATIADTPDATIKFFDGDTLVGSDKLLAAVGGDWSWNGWASDLDFNRVTVESNYTNRGGFLMHDAVRVLTTQVPAPGSLALLATGLIIGTHRRR